MSACIEWPGRTNAKGYGVDPYGRLAHRLAYGYENIPAGWHVDHRCGNRRCVNTDHLEAVTARANAMRALEVRLRRTHCRNGHSYAARGTWRMQAGKWSRRCRECNRLWTERRRKGRVQ